VNLVELPARDDAGVPRAVIETPRGSLVKLKYEPSLHTFALSRPLVLGVAYPFDWGFFPRTVASDGDPLDVMVVHDAATYPGVVIPCRLVGLVKVTQQDPNKRGRQRNDRVIAVPAKAPRLGQTRTFPDRFREELEQFFLNAVLMEGKKLRIEGWAGADQAQDALRRAEQAYAKREKS
jgi:inorganic pyrophosphatase